ncbi:hypothetical protein LOTGIDRAFT_238255 [Lottia gigantea]|uniref:Ribosome biogenesis protein WDR12 homolog n=1 Tax=Lottia gigantea TaxID=225164 RepID=V4AVY2_LOTGI|nr:hypothetical protein LOTGIDRAFT_238255 [Lottia gigantea]ESP01568.1 hypothetical protein LOTGIDRAFT_238255 [Lottia gigantea]
MEDENTPHVQTKFFTKQAQYSVPDTPFSVPVSAGVEELTSLINGLLTGDEPQKEDTEVIKFDFLVHEEFLRKPLNEFLDQKDISSETVLEIEYLEHHPAPQPENSLLHDDWVSCLQGYSKYVISGCYDNTIRLWSTEGEEIMTIPAHSGPVKTVQWITQDPDDKAPIFMSGSHDQTIHIWQWNIEKKEVDCIVTCRGHTESVDCLAVDAENERFCSGSWDKMLKIWSSASTAEEDTADDSNTTAPKKKKKTDHIVPTRVPILTLSGHKEAVSSACWLNSAEVCTASWDNTLRFWDINRASEKSQLQGPKAFFNISYSALNGTIVAGGSDRFVRLYDPRSNDGAVVKSVFSSHKLWIAGVAWSSTNENHFISGSHDSLVKLWDKRSPKAPLYDMAGHEDKILAVDWSLPELMMSSGADNSIKIYSYSETKQKIGDS